MFYMAVLNSSKVLVSLCIVICLKELFNSLAWIEEEEEEDVVFSRFIFICSMIKHIEYHSSLFKFLFFSMEGGELFTRIQDRADSAFTERGTKKTLNA